MIRAFVLTLALAATIAGAAAADPLKIRQGYGSAPGSMAPIIFEQTNLLRHYGQSYTVEFTRFASAAPQMTAFAGGELDLANFAYANLGMAVINAKIDDARIVSDGFQDGVPGYYSVQFFATNDSPVKGVDDLRGRVIATNAIGGAADIAVRGFMRTRHLEEKTDYRLIEGGFATLVPMMFDHKADVIALVPPFNYDPRLKDGARVVFTQSDLIGQSQMNFVVAHAAFLQKNRAALTDYYEDYLHGLDWFLDPKNRAQAIDIVAKFTKVPAEQYAGWLFDKGDYYHNPDALIDVGVLKANLELCYELGILSKPIDPANYLDESIVQDARKHLTAEGQH
ncbi:MAG TPA: ABC transporter substrate-binding protein [Stellaceae bacterium]